VGASGVDRCRHALYHPLMDDSTWMKALGTLRASGLPYDRIATEIGASSRSVRRWDQYRVRVSEGARPSPAREAVPIPTFAAALVTLSETPPLAG